ncbi:MAG: SDR family NAD(P)-dependent oxidoreductase [Spirochaetaceae bacterium]
MNVVITGSTRGIGLGLVREFLKHGHNVLINGRDRMVASTVAGKLSTEFPGNFIHVYACDVTCYNSVSRMFWEANRYFGSVDIWINNAGMSQNRQSVTDHDLNKMNQIIDLNIKAVLYGTQIASRGMSEKGGYIYNMEGYGSNDMMTANMSFYGMTKRALTYFTKSAAKEVKGSNVKIGLLSPGMVVTDLLLSSLPEDKNEKDKVIKIYNILADRVEDVSLFLVKAMLKNSKNGVSIQWLTNRKVFLRFFTQIFKKRKVVY